MYTIEKDGRCVTKQLQIATEFNEHYVSVADAAFDY